MLAYKPKEQPILSKIFESGLFQFLMVVFLGVGVTYFVVRTDQPQQLIQRINRFASTSPIQNQRANTEAGIAEDKGQFEAPPPEANTWGARSASGTEMAAMAASAGAAPLSTSSATATTSQTQLVSGTAKLRIRMVEADLDYLDNLTSEKTNGEVFTTNGNIKSFRSVPKLSINNSYLKVLKTDVLEFNKDKKLLSILAGTATRGIRMNFKVLDEMTGERFRFLDAQFVKMHASDNRQIPIELFLVLDEFTLIYGADLISYFEAENDLSNVAPFTIFKSADYRNQKTTFAIIIEVQ